MAKYTEYKTKTGTFWHVRGYLGVDSTTGVQKGFNKRGFRTKKEAQLSYSRAKHQFENGLYAALNNSFTYEEVYHEWVKLYKLDVKESTLNKTLQLFELHILPAIGSMKIKKIQSKLIQNLVNDWRERFSQYTKLFNYTNKVFDYALIQGYITEHPKHKVIMPARKLEHVENKAKTKTFYDKQELMQLFHVMENEKTIRWHAFFRLLAFSGIRRGEALALTWNDINFKEKSLSIDKTLSLGVNNKKVIQPPKTKNAIRVISLDDNTLEILKNWKKEQAHLLIGFGFNAMKHNQLVFSKYESNDYLDLSAPRNKLEHFCKLHNLEMIKIHGFRHTHASLLFEAGVPMKDVKERLGHSDIKVTMNVYTHVTKDSADNSAELFANYVNF